MWVERPNQYDALLKATGDWGTRDPVLYPTVDGAKLTLFVLLPLICGWLFLFVLPTAIRWVRNGFRQ
jgi:hypothetical protein